MRNLIVCISFPLIFLSANQRETERQYTLNEIYKTGEVHFTREIELSDKSLPPDAFFENPLCADYHEQGLLFVGDSGSATIKKFDKNGNFLGVVGRKGQGPGEFLSIHKLVAGENQLLVWDFINKRMSALNFDGMLSTSRQYLRHTGIPLRMRALPSGDFVVAFEKRDVSTNKSPQVYRIENISGNLSHIKTIYTKELNRLKYIYEPGFAEVFQPFRANVYWDCSPDGKIVIGFSGTSIIEIFNVNGILFRSFKYEAERIKITDEDKLNYFSKMRIARIVNGVKMLEPGAPSYIKNNTEFPEFKDGFKSLAVDSEGNIWIQPYLKDRSEENSCIDVFTPRGVFINRVKIFGINYGLHSVNLKIKNGICWIIERDEDGYPQIVKYRIARQPIT
jgi:hypothetical protein